MIQVISLRSEDERAMRTLRYDDGYDDIYLIDMEAQVRGTEGHHRVWPRIMSSSGMWHRVLARHA